MRRTVKNNLNEETLNFVFVQDHHSEIEKHMKEAVHKFSELLLFLFQIAALTIFVVYH
jgi:hypothetical protein